MVPPGKKCHTDTCPTGVATQDRWLAHGLDPALKSVRAANYIKTLRRDLLKVSEACGVEHPALIGPESVEIVDTVSRGRPLQEVYAYRPGWGVPGRALEQEVVALMDGHREPAKDSEGPPETAEG